jgi:hypothetical protein
MAPRFTVEASIFNALRLLDKIAASLPIFLQPTPALRCCAKIVNIDNFNCHI